MKKAREMIRALMVGLMIGLIVTAGVQPALAQELSVNGTNLDFFQNTSWVDGSVPDVNSSYAIRWGQGNAGDTSMIYDPANQSPGNMVYAVGTNATTGDYSLNADGAGESYTLTQESGDVTWDYSVNYRNFHMGNVGDGTYVMNDGIARFRGRGLRVIPSDTQGTYVIDQNGGAVICDPHAPGGISTDQYGLWLGGTGGGIYSLAAGTVQTTGLRITDAGVINFEAGSTGALYVLTSGGPSAGANAPIYQSAADMLALIAAGDIVALGGETILVTELLAGDYTGHTEVKLDLPVIPEPAGLGLIGLALLAVRRKRS